MEGRARMEGRMFRDDLARATEPQPVPEPMRGAALSLSDTIMDADMSMEGRARMEGRMFRDDLTRMFRDDLTRATEPQPVPEPTRGASLSISDTSMEGRARMDGRMFRDDLTRATEPQPVPEPTRGAADNNPHERGSAKSMDPDIYKAATAGEIDAIEKATEDTECSRLVQVTPQKNTVLHLASSAGHHHLVELILRRCPGLFTKKNSMGNLALHVATCAGHLSIVESLTHFARMNEEDVFTEVNKERNTALHVALKNQRRDVAKFLVESDPTVSFMPNGEAKTPLYMAAEAGWLELVKAMMEMSGDPIIDVQDVLEDNPLVHGAIVGRNRDILDTILSNHPMLINLTDKNGSTPLSFAASTGYLEGVHYFLVKFTQQVYQRDGDGSFPIHIASAKGHIDMIQEFLQHCPDTVELLNRKGQNILHVAAMSGKSNVVSYMLKTRELEKLINERDHEGNTPLHLATMNWHPKVVSALTWDNRVDLKILNKDGLTARDASDQYIGAVFSMRKRLTWRALRSSGAPRAQDLCYTSVKMQTSTPDKPPSVESYEVNEKKEIFFPNQPTITEMFVKTVKDVSKPQRTEINKEESVNSTEMYKERVNTLLLVSTLVATVTFAAGITLPGGNIDSGDNEGMSRMINKPQFHVFLICNTIAMYSSITVDVALIWAQLGDLSLVLTALKLVLPLLGVSLSTMSIAFMVGVTLVVSTLNWLANVVLIMGLIFLAAFFVLFVPLCLPVPSGNRFTRYIHYYSFYMIMVLTKSDK